MLLWGLACACGATRDAADAVADADADAARGSVSAGEGGEAADRREGEGESQGQSQSQGELSREERIGPDLVVRALPAVRAFIVTHEQPISANALVVIADDGTPILADTPWTPAATRALLAWIVERFGRAPAFATVSHFHLDASGGIAALREAGVRVVASRETARLIAARVPGMQAELAASYGDAFVGWRVPAPDDLFDPATPRVERVGGTEVQVIFPGAAHAPDNVVTWFPDRQLLFGGCMVKGGGNLGNLGDANLDTYADAVARLQALGARTVVAGHGPRTDAAQLDDTHALAVEARDAR